jgi:hypothetical protein
MILGCPAVCADRVAGVQLLGQHHLERGGDWDSRQSTYQA